MDTFAEMAAKVEGMVTPRRWRHILGVMETAEELALRQNCSREGARVAALLHDCAKDLPKNTLLKLIEDSGIVLDEVEGELYPLWHAPVGAVLARREFGVTDLDILAAIRYHTVGRAGMSLLEKIIYVADIIEPSRDWPGVDKLRSLVFADFAAGCLKALDSAITFILQQGSLLHPGTVAARNQLIREQRSAERR
ncbi:MAG: HD domain-containing protein [Firmicutes bacterium]|nr:HD domain-containing protein [Bacillota bacterium]